MRYFDHDITDKDLLKALCDEKRYRIDAEVGEIYSVRTGKPLARENPASFGGKTNRDCIRISVKGKRRHVSVAKAIWMFDRRATVPKMCEVHHSNEDSSDNRGVNLVCIFEADHHLVHKLLSGSAPF